ncbi:MAG: hypothetical protein ACQEQ4_10435 [Fibrobacterota bacterium]
MIRKIIYGVAAGIILVGCAHEWDDYPPEINVVLKDIAIYQGDSLTISMKFVDAVSRLGRELRLEVAGRGDNYTNRGMTIIPDPDFYGELFVPLRVDDGRQTSKRDTLKIRVKKRVQLIPLSTGNLWVYQDTGSGFEEPDTSELEVEGLEETSSEYGDMYRLRWNNLDTELFFVYANADEGSVVTRAFSDEDTMDLEDMSNGGFRFKYPVYPGDEWQHTKLIYSVSGNEFREEILPMTCTDTAAYISVPVGSFRCKVFTVLHEVELKNGSFADEKINYYYAPGIGYIKYERYINERLVRKKELIEYYVQ